LRGNCSERNQTERGRSEAVVSASELVRFE
jgi:hypothetical protein